MQAAEGTDALGRQNPCLFLGPACPKPQMVEVAVSGKLSGKGNQNETGVGGAAASCSPHSPPELI